MMKSRLKIMMILLALLSFSVPIYSAVSPVQLEVEEALTCLCGCGQTVKSCPHENCGFAIPAKTRITALLNSGKNKAQILEDFLKQYGEEVLSAPTKKGFNLLGYIMPFAALLVAAGLLYTVIRSWAAKGVKDEVETLPKAKEDFGSEIDEKIEKELEEMD